MKKGIIAGVLIILSAAVVQAADLAHGSGVPTKTILFQILNLSVLIIGIVYFTKNAVKNAFSERKKTYIIAAEKSKEARDSAEKQFNLVKEKIEHLEASKEKDIQLAKEQAEQLKKQMNQEALAVSEKIKADVQLTVKIELQKAKESLRQELIKESYAIALKVISKDIGNADQERLQNEFIENIKMVKQ